MVEISVAIMSTAEQALVAAVQAAQVAAQAAQAAAEKISSSTAQGVSGPGKDQTSLLKLINTPEPFAPKTRDEEVMQWSEWKYGFVSWLSGAVDVTYREELEHVEKNGTTEISDEDLSDQIRRRTIQLFTILGTLLRGRPLKIHRAMDKKGTRSGFEI